MPSFSSMITWMFLIIPVTLALIVVGYASLIAGNVIGLVMLVFGLILGLYFISTILWPVKINSP